MPKRKARARGAPELETERKRLKDLLDAKFGPKERTVRIYRIEDDGKQTPMGAIPLADFAASECVLEMISNNFGAGDFLVRTVLENGTFGPSRMVSIADRSMRSFR